MSQTLLAELFLHNAWANQQMLQACANLTDGQLDAGVDGTYGSIRKTLVHLCAAQERYVALLTGNVPDHPLRESNPFPGFAELLEHTQRSNDALVDVANTADPDSILRGVRNGEAYAIPISTVVIQAINHATEHRVQVATILTQQGIEPPDLDGWTYGERQQ